MTEKFLFSTNYFKNFHFFVQSTVKEKKKDIFY